MYQAKVTCDNGKNGKSCHDCGDIFLRFSATTGVVCLIQTMAARSAYLYSLITGPVFPTYTGLSRNRKDSDLIVSDIYINPCPAEPRYILHLQTV